MSKKLEVEFITSLDTWGEYLARVEKSNLLQSVPYALAMRRLKKIEPRLGVIKIDGEPCGIFQSHEASILFGLVHTVTIDRGPLWFSEPAQEEWKLFLEFLASNYKNRRLRYRRFMPELSKEDAQKLDIASYGFREIIDEYESAWIDLSQPLQKIRSGFKSGWMSALKKAEKSDIQLFEANNPPMLRYILKSYAQDKLAKKYHGPAPQLVKAICDYAAPRAEMLALLAYKDSKAAAGLIIFSHGNAATYQIGFSNDWGRKNNAMHLLLFESIKILKAKGLKWFDLGGINEKHAAGVTKFKDGMGGKRYDIVGLYR